MTQRKRTTKKARSETWQSVLVLDPNPVSRSTVRRHYAAWRRERELPDRCDIVGCMFFTAPLEWNGKPLKLIVDHEDGNRFNNTPANRRTGTSSTMAMEPASWPRPVAQLAPRSSALAVHAPTTATSSSSSSWNRRTCGNADMRAPRPSMMSHLRTSATRSRSWSV